VHGDNQAVEDVRFGETGITRTLLRGRTEVVGRVEDSRTSRDQRAERKKMDFN